VVAGTLVLACRLDTAVMQTCGFPARERSEEVAAGNRHPGQIRHSEVPRVAGPAHMRIPVKQHCRTLTDPRKRENMSQAEVGTVMPPAFWVERPPAKSSRDNGQRFCLMETEPPDKHRTNNGGVQFQDNEHHKFNHKARCTASNPAAADSASE
jgi:hypothetical protein